MPNHRAVNESSFLTTHPCRAKVNDLLQQQRRRRKQAPLDPAARAARAAVAPPQRAVAVSPRTFFGLPASPPSPPKPIDAPPPPPAAAEAPPRKSEATLPLCEFVLRLRLPRPSALAALLDVSEDAAASVVPRLQWRGGEAGALAGDADGELQTSLLR